VPKEPREGEGLGFRIRDFIPVLNSLFETAKINITIVELVFFKEQVVIGFPQGESLENELKLVERVEDFGLGGRYIALGILASSGRHIPTYVRFYLTSAGKLIREDFGDNGVTLVDPEEIKKPEIWRGVIDYVVPWAPIIAKFALSYFGIIAGDPE